MKKNLSWMFVGNLAMVLSQFIVITLISKIMGIESLGTYTLALAIVSPVSLFFHYQLKVVIISEENPNFYRYYYFRLINMFFSILLIVSISLLFYSNSASLIILLGLQKLIEGLSDIVIAFYQRSEKMKYIGQNLILKSLLQIMAFLCGMYIFDSLSISLLIYIVILFIYHIAFELVRFKTTIKCITIDSKVVFNFKQLYKVAIPLGIVVLLGSLNSNVIKIIVEIELGLYVLGIIGSLTYFITAINIFFTSIMQVFNPRLAKSFNNKDISSLFKYIFIIMLIIVVIFIGQIGITYFLGEFLLKFLFTEEVAKYKNLLYLFSVFAGVSYLGSLVGNLVTIMKIYTFQIYINLLKLIALIFITPILIGNFGISGVVTSQIIVGLLSTVIYIIMIFINLRKKELI